MAKTSNVHQSHSQNDSGGVAGGDGDLGCLCGKAGTSHLCDGSAHSCGCVLIQVLLPEAVCCLQTCNCGFDMTTL